MKEKQPIGDKARDFSQYFNEHGRDEIDLGEYADGTHLVLPPYVEIDGVQYHPTHPVAQAYLAGKKT